MKCYERMVRKVKYRTIDRKVGKIGMIINDIKKL